MQRKSYSSSDRSQYDMATILTYVMLCIVGILTIYSSIYSENAAWLDFSKSYTKQLVFFGISVFVGIVILYTESNLFFHLGYIIFGAVLLLTSGTFVFGAEVHGAQAWYKIGSIQLQPAEFAKIGAVLGLSKFLGTYGIKLNSLKNYGIAFLFLLLPMGIVLAQNDTGSALVFLSLILVLYRFGLPGWILGIGVSYIILFSVLMLLSKHESILGLSPELFIVGVLLIIFLILFIVVARKNKPLLLTVSLSYIIHFVIMYFALQIMDPQKTFLGISAGSYITIIATIIFGFFVVIKTVKTRIISWLTILYISFIGFTFIANYAFDHLKGYQKRRIQLIYGLIEDKRGTGYNLNQSKIAIGSGQLTGKGYLEGTQAKQRFVPEPDTDFIFCTLAEETGFIGSAAFVLLYLYFLYRIALMAERQNSRFARSYGYGVFSILLFHFIINVGMTMGMVPTIGIPLPFISYGGSSLLAFTTLLFIFIKLDANRGNEVSIDLR